MSLKFELDTLDGVDESMAGFYEKTGDKFRLKVEGAPPVEDVKGLKLKNDELLAEAKSAKKALKDAEDKAERERQEALARSGDVEAIRKDAEERLSRVLGEKDAELGGYRSLIQDLTVNSTAQKIASDLAIPGSAEVLLPHVRARLSLEMVEGKPTVRVLGPDGKPSTASVDDLKKEISGNAAFKPLIVASLASGAGGSGANKGGGAAKTLDDLSGAERTDMAKNDPAGFAKLVEAAKNKGN